MTSRCHGKAVPAVVLMILVLGMIIVSAPFIESDTTGDTDTSSEITAEEIQSKINETITPGTVTVSGYYGDIDILLNSDVTGYIEIPGSWGYVTLNLCGHTFQSNNVGGAVILSGKHVGEMDSVLISNDGATSDTDGNVNTGKIIGYNGGPAISSTEGSSNRLSVGGNVEITGGAAIDSGNGGAAISGVYSVYLQSDSTIVGGNASGNGNGGAAIVVPSSYRLSIQTCTITGGNGAGSGSGGKGIVCDGSGTAGPSEIDSWSYNPSINGGIAGDGTQNDSMDDVIEVVWEFAAPVIVSQSSDKITVSLTTDVGAVVMDPSWGAVELNLCGFTIQGSQGTEGYAISVGNSSLAIIGPGSVLGCDGDDEASGGAAAILFTDAGGTLTVSGGAQIVGGAGADGAGGSGGVGIAVSVSVTTGLPAVTVTGSSVVGGAGGQGATGSPGGTGGAAASGVSVTLSGNSSLTGGAGGVGGNGSTSAEASDSNGGAGGNGGQSIIGGSISSPDGTSVVTGGTGGAGGYSSSGNGGPGGAGGDTPIGTGGAGGAGGYAPNGTGGAGGTGGNSADGAGGAGGTGGNGSVGGGAGGTGGNGSTEESNGSTGSNGSDLPSMDTSDITLTIYSLYGDSRGPLQFATVTVKVGDRVYSEGVTDESGQITISGIVSGTYSLVIENYSNTCTTVLEVDGSPTYDVVVNTQISTFVSGNVEVMPSNLGDAVDPNDLDIFVFGVNMNADVETDPTAKANLDSYATEYVTLIDYTDVTIYYASEEAGAFDNAVSRTYLPITFRLPVSSELIDLLDDPVNSILAYRLHGTSSTSLTRVTESSFSSAGEGCFYITSEYNGLTGALEYYAVIKSQLFSTFALGYQSSTPPESDPTPSTSITAEAIDNLVYITITNPQAGREYAVRDAAGALQTSWTSGTGTIRFGPLQPGDTYSVVGRSTVLLRESVDAVFVIPEVPEIIVVEVTAESVTLASEEGVRYTLTDADGRTVGRVTGTGSDILWENLDAGTAYYAEAEVGQGRIILTAGPVLVKPAMDGTVVGDIRHEEAYVYVEGSEGWEYRMDGGAWTSSERIVFGPLSPGIAVLESRETESGITMEKRIDVPTVPTRAESTETSVTITTEEGKTYMLSDVDGASVTGPGGAIWVAGTGGDVTWEDLDPAVDYFVHIQTGEGEDAMLFGPETVKLAEEVVQVSGTNEGFSVYITIDNLSSDREYTVAGGDGSPVTEWVAGTPGPVEFGHFEFGATYLVLSREAGSTETLGGLQVEATLVIPEAPDFGSAEYADGVLTMDSVEEWRYQLVDPSGGPVDSGSGIWTDGTGGTLTWTGLDQAGEYFMYAALEDGVLSMSLGPMQVGALVSWTLGDETADVEAASTDKVTIDSVEGSSYLLTDSEGNIAPGPGGQIWVVGTGDALVWTGLDPEKDYSYTIRTVDPETGEVVQSGPHAIPRASEPADSGNPIYALAVVVLIIAYIAFMRLVHREGPFDRRAWLVTAAVLVIAAATGLLYSGIWWQAGITVLAAAAFLSWLYYSDRAAPDNTGRS